MSSGSPDLRLGLIGDHIARSQAPRLHRLAGEICGLDVRYDSLIPADLGQSFETVFAACANGAYRGINVTYPYKAIAAARVRIDAPLVHAIGTINTVLFEPGGARGQNTDHTGFKAAYARLRGDTPPGPTLMIGAGGVGRAIAFALVALGAKELRLADRDPQKARALARDLSAAAPGIEVRAGARAELLVGGAEGLLNCTPVGMDGDTATPLAREAMIHGRWAFDAVYTPRETRFLADAAAEGLAIISGWELFFYQGVHAWKVFSGRDIDEDALRRRLLEAGPA